MKTHGIATRVLAAAILLIVFAVSVFGVFAAVYAVNHPGHQTISTEEVMVFPLIERNEGASYECNELDQKET